jgi:two-component system LytT family response regulator
MIKALIVDDEANNRQMLRVLVERHCPTIEDIDEAADAEEAYRKIDQQKPKLVFLDIRMPGKTGFDLLKMFPKIEFEVIFVTAYDQYAIRAFEFNAIDYIIKPISVPRLVNAVNKVSERIKKNENTEPIFHFVKTLLESNELNQKLPVHHNGKVVIINVSEIASIQVADDRTMITLTNKAHYYSSKDLVRFEKLFEGMLNFLRISKSVIINVHVIKTYTKGDPFLIELSNNQVFEVARRRKAAVLSGLRNDFHF